MASVVWMGGAVVRHPVVIEGAPPMMEIEVDGEMRRRECYVDCSLSTLGVPGRLKPETRDGEILLETVDGQMIIVQGQRDHARVDDNREMTWREMFEL